MRVIGDIDDDRPAEPGDLRIVGRRGYGLVQYQIEQAQERLFGLRWLGLRWVALPELGDFFRSPAVARARAERAIADNAEELERLILDASFVLLPFRPVYRSGDRYGFSPSEVKDSELVEP